jgi:UDP-N-acetylmuramate dehydrogenase
MARPKKPGGNKTRGAKAAARKAAPKPAPAAAAVKRAPRARAAATPGDGRAFPAGLNGVLKEGENLARYTTFRIGGPARWFFTPGDVAAVEGAVAWARSSGVPWLVLGLGSNVLIRDGGFNGLVVRIGKGLDALAAVGSTWKVGAGLPTPLLARRSAEAGMAGLQRLIGVPGTAGGGVFMNAGAHGQDYASVLVSATVLTPEGKVAERARKSIPFSYRRSGLDGHVVLGCSIAFVEEDPRRLRDDMLLMLKRRRAGTPFDQPCCGSVFKNPEDVTAGRLIDKCGLKGRRVGGAEISPLHANYIVNKGSASADDVLKLIDIARTEVFREFGVELALEVKVLGENA